MNNNQEMEYDQRTLSTSIELEKVIPKKPFWKTLIFQMVLGLLLGLLVGHFFPLFATELSPLSAAFMKLIKAVVGLIIFCTIAVGIARIGSQASVGRIALKSILYFEIMTTLAMIVGLVIVNTVKPGEKMNIDPTKLDSSSLTNFSHTAESHTIVGWLMTIIPDTFVSAFTNGNILPILFIAILFGVAFLKMGHAAEPIVHLIEKLSEAIFIIVGMIMKLAPLAVFGAISYTIGKYGVESFIPLIKFLLLFYVCCSAFILIVLGSVSYLYQINIFKLIRYFKEELILAFSTASSEAALPNVMKKLEQYGCKKHVVGFVIPAGFSFNLDGSSMYFIMAIIFLAQACNINLTLIQEISLILIFMITSKGIAGVAGSGFVTLIATLSIFPYVPVAAVVLLLGIDRFMDSMRTFTNLIGNIVAVCIVDKSESKKAN
ncbi:C4-dicarboxylate transport protein [Acinetobacter gyllenbergii]|uniref:cation:dicarboxylate symporter family transporter n=1 Tax=Acinetobacter gyllenbergii TaxID=134534 RepID=UPI0003533881|nr:cation:dicarboxylase symporter family transporter [Acinetobacter gyllenbergii]EPH32410.1 Aerobic C4-dicarboxylate transporter for fumarate, L-malate, D-malate, succunate [Acinetobacter gyllenbergii CIP 110306 = MTCC 11365]GMA11916.1 C4-dicarboxylate transport protein [Acinetobacter gyllenbergii]